MIQKQELLSNLRELLNIITEHDEAKAEVDIAQQKLQSSDIYTTHLETFDADHLEPFIEEKIGPRPVEPSGLIKILVPVYLIQKSQYDAAIATYEKLRPLAEAAYRETFHTERETLRLQDETESAENVEKAKKQLDLSIQRRDEATTKLNLNNTISSSLKQKCIVERLVSYLEEGRADDLKEAVNLYYDEMRKDEEARKAEAHRQEMKELEEEKVRAALEAAEYQKKQYEEAERAAYYAERAAEQAEEARKAAETANNSSFYDNM